METMELKAYTLQPTPNATYLNNYKNVSIPAAPMNGTTMGLMMLLSTLQWQAPYMAPQYSNAASQAGKAAYIQSGGQAVQDKLMSKTEGVAKDTYHSLGVTDTEVGVVLGGAKIVRDRQVDVNGPRIYFIHTHVTVGTDHANLGLGFNF